MRVKVLDPVGRAPATDPTEALIKEARRRTRRRRLALAGVCVVLVAGGLVGVLVSQRGGVPPAPTATLRPVGPGGPVVDEAAFAGHGELAFVSKGTLFLLDGSTRTVREVATPGLVASDPAFSPDGRWLAFAASKEVSADLGGVVVSTVLSSTLWLARADGSDAHEVAGLSLGTAYGWSPHADLFAASAQQTVAGRTEATSVDVIAPSGALGQVVGGTDVIGAAWSPDGSALAVSTENGVAPESSLTGTLASYPIGGGSPRTWRTQAGYMVPVGWWSRWGIGYTTVAPGAVPGGSATLDGTPFVTLASPDGVPRTLGATLPDLSTGAPSTSGAGWLAFVDSGRGGRTVWQGKQVVVCSPAGGCTPVPHPAGTVTLDPVWSPSGATLAYVEAPADQSVGFPQSVVTAWYGAHQLRLFDPVTGSTSAYGTTPGATTPLWPADGTSLLYVSGNAVWLHPAASAPPVEIASPLFTPGQWPAYYGQVPFSAQFAWSPAQEPGGGAHT